MTDDLDRDPMLDAALAFAKQGYQVFPLGRNKKTPAISKRAGGQGFKDAVDDPMQIICWWGMYPGANIGIATGASSGIVIIDVDLKPAAAPPVDGYHDLAKLIVDHDDPLMTLEAGTPSGGCHLYFAHPGVRIGNDSKKKLGPGLDVRGDGGYVAAPPSTIDGFAYEYCTGFAEPEPMPLWLIELLRDRERPQHLSSVPPPAKGSRYWMTAMESELARLDGVPEGERNAAMNIAAFRMGQLIPQGASEQVLRQALLRKGLAIGLTEHELVGIDGKGGTINSGLSGGQRKARVMVA